MTRKTHLLFSVVSPVVVLLAVSWGVSLVGSPTTARLIRFDQQ